MTKKVLLRALLIVGVLLVLFFAFLYVLAAKEEPEHVTYGMTFSAPYVLELGLDPSVVFDAYLNELNVRHFRLAAHWTLTEPRPDVYDFSWIDEQVQKVEDVNGTIIFGVGRRLPRWPECHVPDWAETLTWEEQKTEILEYMKAVVLRYKDSPAITHWQVENEPYLDIFAREHCGELDETFLDEEIALVRELDPMRPILVTDSGNLGTWNGAYGRGDAFGTSVYVYFWNPELGQFRTILPPWFYRAKEGFMELVHGEKQTFLIELSLEPWLIEPVVEIPIETQFSRMNPEKMKEILSYARETRFETQYLWGAEWWYWLRKQGHPEMWEEGKKIFE